MAYGMQRYSYLRVYTFRSVFIFSNCGYPRIFETTNTENPGTDILLYNIVVNKSNENCFFFRRLKRINGPDSISTPLVILKPSRHGIFQRSTPRTPSTPNIVCDALVRAFLTRNCMPSYMRAYGLETNE